MPEHPGAYEYANSLEKNFGIKKLPDICIFSEVALISFLLSYRCSVDPFEHDS